MLHFSFFKYDHFIRYNNQDMHSQQEAQLLLW